MDSETESPISVIVNWGDELRKTRDILRSLPEKYEIDPSRIRITHNGAVVTGGQGDVVLGTLMPSESDIQTEGQPEPETTQNGVAVKRPLYQSECGVYTPQSFKAFVNEIRLIARLSHPSIISLVGFVDNRHTGELWLILPWEANGNVREFLRSGYWDIPERISLIQDTAAGIDYLHSLDPPVCHGDLKSLNILVSSSFNAIITDFGSARTVNYRRKDPAEGPQSASRNVLEAAQTLSSPKAELNPSGEELTLTGPQFTIRWAAPEVLDDGNPDLPSDMWSLGWICWEMVTGKVPFDEVHLESVVISHVVYGKLPAIRNNADLSHVLKLCTMMTDCWKLDPVERIGASLFQRRANMMPSTPPSSGTDSNKKTRSARLLLELGNISYLQQHTEQAEAHYHAALDIAARTNDLVAKGYALESLGNVHLNRSDVHMAEASYVMAHNAHSASENDYGAANALLCLGKSYRAQSKNPEAKRVMVEAHKIYSRSGEDLGMANALDGLANISLVESRNREAEKVFKGLHSIQSQIGNDLGAANALDGLGCACLMQSKSAEAEKAFSEAHAIHVDIGNMFGAADALIGLGKSYYAQLRLNEAEVAFKEAHTIHTSLDNRLGAANALLGLGKVYIHQPMIGDAERAFTEAHDIASRIENDLTSANALIGLGKVHRLQSKDEEAERLTLNAYEIYSRIGNELGTSNALLDIGRIYLTQGKSSEAEKALTEAHAVYSRMEHEPGAADALRDLAVCYRAQSREDEAEKSLKEAHAIQVRIGYDLGLAHTCRELGTLYHGQSRHGDAEKLYREAAMYYERANGPVGVGGMLVLLAINFLDQERYVDAEDPANEALAIFISIGDAGRQMTTSMLLSRIYNCEARFDDEIEALTLAESASEEGDRPTARAVILGRLGYMYCAQERYTEAEDSLRLAQTIYLSIGDATCEGEVLCSLGMTYGCQREYEQAEGCFAEARLKFASVGSDEGEAEALDGLMQALLRQGRVEELRPYCRDACEIYTRTGRAMSDVCAAVWENLHDEGDSTESSS